MWRFRSRRLRMFRGEPSSFISSMSTIIRAGSRRLFGGSIKVYPLTKLKPGFHHLIPDASMGLPYICQVRTANSEEVNGYKAMTRVLRWLEVYSIWERTGVDIDR